MAPKVWFIKNMTHEAAGLFSLFAEKAGISHAIVDLHRGEGFPKVSRGQAVILLGGPDSANDETPKILNELEAIRKCMREQIPCLGICLGLQLLAKAAGGAVLKNPIREVGFRDPAGGWFEMEKTPDGQKDPLLSGISDPCKVFQLHGDTVSITSSMTRLARGRFCENQVVRIQPYVYGIQGHVELSERMFEDWLAADGDLQKMNAAALRKDFLELRQKLEKNSEKLFMNFMRISDTLR